MHVKASFIKQVKSSFRYTDNAQFYFQRTVEQVLERITTYTKFDTTIYQY